VVPADALSGIVRTARGSDVTITTSVLNSYEAERLLEGEELEEEQLTSSSVTEVTISSGRTAITSWGGRSITLSLPVDSRNFEARERYTVYQISENGGIEEHTGRCVRSGGALFVEVDVTHLSTFVVVPTAAETADEEKAPEALPTNVYLPFVDTANHWALDSIGYVYQKGLMSGTGAYNFQPNISMSRAMFVTVLHRLEGTPASTGVNVYSDVVLNGWYTDAVTWATSAGIVNGTGEGKFSPNASISREEMATMMMRYAKYKSYDTAATTDLASYADAYQIHDWAYRAMEWANSTGMITGRTAFTLVPQGTATRAETATILVRFIQKFMPSKY
ncbi:MAG: S-layer homology domain-containing protein, partial [Oscillibacter sp.]|nr:S-layer homology domain-containing protein [Oscillibacter sp.]